MLQTKESKIILTAHAKQRLKERASHIHPNNYNCFVHAARYNGLTLGMMRTKCPETYEYIRGRYHIENNTTQIRLYSGYVFVFCGNKGKSVVLRTVVPMGKGMIMA